MRTGIFGGTFNPIHLAHLRIAEEVRERCALDRVLFIPAATPPHKSVAQEVPFADRMAMVLAAIQDNPAFETSDLEAQRPGKSYSVHTLEILRRERPSEELFFIMGMDSFLDLPSWKDFQRIFDLAHLVVTTRPGYPESRPESRVPVAMAGDFCYDYAAEKLLHKSGKSVFFLEVRFDISSTEIRKRVAGERSIRYLVPKAVEDYIRANGLYQNRKG